MTATTERTIDQKPLSDKQLRQVDAQWRAADYLSAGQLYLLDNPLLATPLLPEHVKPHPSGHWGTCPGLNLITAHLNRAIIAHDVDLLPVFGPTHGAAALFANSWLEGSYSAGHPEIGQDLRGLRALFRQFAFPGGVSGQVTPELPGSIHSGDELGHSLAHAYGAALDNPDLVVACVIGDGEAETGPLAAGWQADKFIDPAHDGAVLPILHLNGYSIGNPALLARIPDDELGALLHGHGYRPYTVSGVDSDAMHQSMAAALDIALGEIEAIQRTARAGRNGIRPHWPMIVLRSPKGWTGPSDVDGEPVEGTGRAHGIPLTRVRRDPAHLRELERWLRGYRPEELFEEDGEPALEVTALIPRGSRRMGANPHANGGLLHRPLDLPDTTRQAQPEGAVADPARALGGYLRDVLERDGRHRDIRLFSPDETVSGRLGAVYEVTRKQWQAELVPGDPHLGRNGRVVEVVSAHLCQGLAEGYVRTGRHALVCCQEAVAPQLAAMTETHLGWLRTHRGLAWRPPVPALTYLLTTRDRTRPNPGFADHLLAGEAGPLRVYLPPDANTLLAVARHCLAEPDVVNLIVAGGQATPTLFDPEAAELHCARGAGIVEDAGDAPDVVLAGAGAAETVEALAAAALLRARRPEVRVRVVNVVDLLRLLPSTEHVRGLTDLEFDSLFTADAPVIFAYHGHSWLIHRLAGRRGGLLVRGHRGAGAGTTPFDALVRNDLDRYRLAVDVIDRVPGLRASAALLRQDMIDRREHHRRWIREHGEDLPEVREWAWQRATGPGP